MHHNNVFINICSTNYVALVLPYLLPIYHRQSPSGGCKTQNQTQQRINKMKKIAKQITAVLVDLLFPKGKVVKVTSRPDGSVQSQETEEIAFCCHPRHGAFPARRKFNFRGTSATGREFVVWQCSAPACGEFVAVTKDTATGRDRIFFRGHHFRPQNRRASAFILPRTAKASA